MENLAYQLADTSTNDSPDNCPACGQALFGPTADACYWQVWRAMGELLGLINVTLLCGACGEDLHLLFRDRNRKQSQVANTKCNYTGRPRRAGRGDDV